MRSPARIGPTMAALTTYWQQHPDMRLGQLIETMRVCAPKQRQMYFIEDDELLEGFDALNAMTT